MRIKDITAAERDRKRHRSSRQTFGITGDVRDHAGLFAGKQAAGSAPSRHDFIGNEKNAVGLANPLHLGKNRRRIDQHPARTQDQRLDDKRRDSAAAASRLQRVKRRVLSSLLRKGDALDVKQQRIIRRIENATLADGHSPDGVAMISAFQRENAAAFFTAVPPETKRHLQCDFDGCRPAVREENILELRRRDRDEPAGKLFRRLVGETGKNNLIETIRLILDRLHDMRVTMTVGYNPPR